MTEKKIKPIRCKNKICNKYLCHSDGELFYVENLEILPKVKGTKKRLKKIIICPRCGRENGIYIKKPTDETGKAENGAPRKFLIFRSRF